MNDFTFLETEQILGEKKLSIIEKIGPEAGITDYAILLGGPVFQDYTIANNSLENRKGVYWTKSADLNSSYTALAINANGKVYWGSVTRRYPGIRLAYNFSKEKEFILKNSKRNKDGILEIFLGVSPERAVQKSSNEELERKYQRNLLKKTGNKYTADLRSIDNNESVFEKCEYKEYEYAGKRYVRVIANSHYKDSLFTLSNKEFYKNGDIVWVEVNPIKWIIDEKEEIMITEKIISAGIQFNQIGNYKGDFENTDIKKFIDNYLSKEIFQTKELIQKEEITEKVKSMTRQNPYDLKFNNVSEEEIIKGSILSNIPVFLHGKSSEGKSARVKQLDPECEIIYLRNATPDSLNGKSVYNSETKEMIDIPPTWYKKIKQKSEEEPDKIHILFFDEITNSLPSIQGMAFNIILDKEVNGIWKLPENVRIVAAGNDLKDSLAANVMAEPLFNRFAHVYINTTVNSWLKWAVTKEEPERLEYKKTLKLSKIHPAIYAYIAYNAYYNQDVLRTPYNGETPNADPRKWEMASKVLYETKEIEMLRSLIGEDLTKDFKEFCKNKVLTVEDVINGNYQESDLEMNMAERFATAVGLSIVDEENFEIIREFMKKLGPEPRATFESLWARGEENRLEIIAELKMSEREGIKK